MTQVWGAGYTATVSVQPSGFAEFVFDPWHLLDDGMAVGVGYAVGTLNFPKTITGNNANATVLGSPPFLPLTYNNLYDTWGNVWDLQQTVNITLTATDALDGSGSGTMTFTKILVSGSGLIPAASYVVPDGASTATLLGLAGLALLPLRRLVPRQAQPFREPV